MSLSLAGYLACVEEKSFLMVVIMAVLAQGLYVMVLTQMPKLLRMCFYPSYAAFTFPFVITAIALRQTLAYLEDMYFSVPEFLHGLLLAETILATVIVLYVFVRYLNFFREQMMPELRIKIKGMAVHND